jgi:predicted acyl esterase
MIRRTLSLLAAGTLVTGLAVALPATAAPTPKGATWTETWFPSGDGTMLHADVLLPKGQEKSRHPVIVSIGPYFGSGSQGAPVWDPTNTGPSARFADLEKDGQIFERGYAFVMVDSRGYGGSDGCNDFGGKGEQLDAKSAVEWAAKQPWSTGKVGMWGKSYDAWTQVMALANKPKGLAAVVIQSPINEGYRVAFENGVHWDSGWYATPSLYADYDLTPPSLSNPQAWVYSVKGTATNPHCYAINEANTPNPDETTAYWKERSIAARAAQSTVPVMWSHGFNDVNTKPTNIFDTYINLRGPKRAWFGQWNHVRGNEDKVVGREGFMDEAMAWFDHYLRGKPLAAMPKTEVQDGDGVWRTEASYPPADGVLREMPVRAGGYADQPGNDSRTPTNGTWSVSQPAPHDVRIAGLPKLTASVLPSTPAGGNLIALLYDVAPGGQSRLMTRGAYKVASGEPFTFELWPMDWLLPRGHRMALQLSADDPFVYQPTYTGSGMTVKSGKLRLPMLTYLRTSNLVGDRASAQSSVPKPKLDSTQLSGHDVRADFGPAMRRR